MHVAVGNGLGLQRLTARRLAGGRPRGMPTAPRVRFPAFHWARARGREADRNPDVSSVPETESRL